MSVEVKPGATQFTLTLGASKRARFFVNAITPALETPYSGEASIGRLPLIEEMNKMLPLFCLSMCSETAFEQKKALFKFASSVAFQVSSVAFEKSCLRKTAALFTKTSARLNSFTAGSINHIASL